MESKTFCTFSFQQSLHLLLQLATSQGSEHWDSTYVAHRLSSVQVWAARENQRISETSRCWIFQMSRKSLWETWIHPHNVTEMLWILIYNRSISLTYQLSWKVRNLRAIGGIVLWKSNRPTVCETTRVKRKAFMKLFYAI